jgi:Probable Zinc-ribbon domain
MDQGHINESAQSCNYGGNAWKLCNEDCNVCFERSFASNSRSNEWLQSHNNDTPRQIHMGSHSKYWFKCNICNFKVQSSLGNVTNENWCPSCLNQIENDTMNITIHQ